MEEGGQTDEYRVYHSGWSFFVLWGPHLWSTKPMEVSEPECEGVQGGGKGQAERPEQPPHPMGVAPTRLGQAPARLEYLRC